MADLSGFDSWKRARPADGRRGRRTRMAVVGLLVVGTIAGLFYALFEPFTAPDVHLVAVHLGPDATSGAVPDGDPESIAVRYANRDSAAFQRIAKRIHRYAPDHASTRIDAAEKTNDVRSLGPKLQGVASSTGNVLILYVSSTGISMNGEAYLEWPASEPNAAPHRARVDDVLKEIVRSPARIKLLLLDAGRRGFSVRDSEAANQFTPLLKAAVEKTNNAGLWVLVSNSALETSHVSHRHRRSYFSLAVTDALSGAADRDGDGQVAIGEFFRFVAANVSANVRRATGHYQTQTPVLCWGNGTATSKSLAGRLLPTLKKDADATGDSDDAQQFPPLIAADVKVKSAGPWLGGSGLRRPQSVIPSRPPLLAALSSTNENPAAEPGGFPKSQVSKSPGAAAKTAKANPAPAAKSDDKPNAEPAPASTPGNIAERLVAAWLLRDRLADRTGGATTPIDFAPQLWRKLETRLLQCERQYRTLGPFADVGADDKSKPAVWPRDGLLLSGELDNVVRLMRALGTRQPLDSPAVTPLEKNFVAFLAASKPPAIAPRTLGMAEMLDARNPGDFPKSLKTAIGSAAAELDRLLATGTFAEFTAWTAKLTSAQLRFVELHLARRLSDATHLNWDDVRLALAARRYSEQIAAFAADDWNWIQADLLEADRLQNAAERQLLDGIGADFRRRFRGILARGVQRYSAVADALQVLRAGRRAYRDAAFRAADIVRWHHATDSGPAGNGPTAQQVRLLLATLNELATKLDVPSASNLKSVRRLTGVLVGVHADLSALADESVRSVSDRLTAGRDALPGDRQRLESALQLPFVNSDLRLKVLQASDRLSHSKTDPLTRDAYDWQGPDQRIVSHDDWRKLLVRADLDVRLAQTAMPAATELPQPVTSALDRLRAVSKNSGTQTAGLWKAHRTLAIELRKARQATPRELMNLARKPDGDGSIDAVFRRGRMLVEMPPAVFDATDLVRRRTRQRAAQRVAAAERRFRAALSDATGTEAKYLTSIGGPLAAHGAPLEIQSPDRISLIDVPADTVTIRIRNTRAESQTIRTVVEFDDRLLKVAPESGDAGLLSRGTDAIPRTASAGVLPLDAAFDAATSTTLADSATHTVRLALRRRDVATSQPTRLVVHVRAGSQIVRRSIPVGLPSAKSLELVVRTPGIDGPTVGRDSGLPELHPFPNRATAFQFQIRSLRRVDRVVDVQVLVPTRRLPLLPAADLSPDELATWRERMGSLTLLGEQKGLKLPGDGSPVRVIPKPAAGAKPNPAPKLDFGLLLVVRDQRSGRFAVRPVTISVQRPRRYVVPRVAFNAETRRLDIRISALNKSWLPSGPVAVQCDVAPKLPDGVDSNLTGELTAEKPVLNLFAILPERLGATVRLNVDVDGFPRAFVFQIPTDRNRESISEDIARRAVAIFVEDKARLTSGPAPTVPVRLEVDAPVGSFQNQQGGDRVEIGVDAGRDRKLDGDVFRRLPTDRDATAVAEEITDDGNVVMRSTVADWKLAISLKDYRNRKVDLLARLVAGQRSAWSNSITVLADSRPPVIEPLRNLSALEGEPLAVAITVSDENLAGVEKVEVAVDSGTGQFAKDPPPSSATAGSQGRWEARIATDKLKPGRYRLLIRATDRAGNATTIVKAPFAILSKKDLETRNQPKPNRVDGIVVWDGEPIAGATVTLSAQDSKNPAKIAPVTTDKNGEFQFPAVPPGKYVLTAKKAALANKNRSVTISLTVPELPETVPTKRVEFP